MLQSLLDTLSALRYWFPLTENHLTSPCLKAAWFTPDFGTSSGKMHIWICFMLPDGYGLSLRQLLFDISEEEILGLQRSDDISAI